MSLRMCTWRIWRMMKMITTSTLPLPVIYQALAHTPPLPEVNQAQAWTPPLPMEHQAQAQTSPHSQCYNLGHTPLLVLDTDISRYTIIDSPVGPKVDIPESPCDTFELLFTPTLLDDIIEQSNLYAKEVMGDSTRG